MPSSVLRQTRNRSSCRASKPRSWAEFADQLGPAVSTTTLPSPDTQHDAARSVWVALVASTLIQALASMAALSTPVLGPLLAESFAVPTNFVGYYISLVYLAATLSSTVGSEAVQRLGAVRVSQWCLVLCALGLGLTATGNLAAAVLGTLLIGVGYGPVTPASSQWLTATGGSRNMGLIFAIKQTGVPLGGTMAGIAIPWLVARGEWQMALVVAGCACALVALAVQPLRATVDRDRQPNHWLSFKGIGEQWTLLCSNRSLHTLAFASFWLSTFQLSLTTYVVTFLHTAFGYSLVAAGATMSAAQIAGVVGRILWGAMADRWLGSVRMLIALAIGMAAGGLILAALGPQFGLWLPAVIVVAVSAFSLGWNGTFLAEVARQAPPGMAGRATGAILSCTFAGVVVGPPTFGAIAAWTDSYRLAFALAAVGPAIAAGLLLARRRMFTTHPERESP